MTFENPSRLKKSTPFVVHNAMKKKASAGQTVNDEWTDTRTSPMAKIPQEEILISNAVHERLFL
ncbi:hypothetical protein MAR_018518 [Mya arenaria]|uniref:Uncharacterized protein n=1 Tax=Mya arenaria TaxID=6604 RepID=A0ABY7EHG5_MYAAR|nr:hypothetical protein MAR_018518 [Mya arenaria]